MRERSRLQRWQLKDYDVGGGIAAGADRGADGSGWIDAEAPGDTYLALIAAGRLADPFRGRHEQEASWVAGREWWWRTRFEDALPLEGERVELVFEGLDTYAAVYLNGALLGRTDNMFRAWRFDVGSQLRRGANELAICFTPPAHGAPMRTPLPWGPLTEQLGTNRRNLMRKAQFGWGWDWGPCLPTVGVWQPAYLERTAQARIAGLRFATTALSPDLAELQIEVEVEVERLAGAGHGTGDGETPLQLEIVLLDPEGACIARRIVAARPKTGILLNVSEPRLWWTADLGAQPLYRVEARLLRGPRLLDAQHREVGIRTIALDTSADPAEPGTQFFRFVLNGVPIFARGANWIPASSFVGAVDEARYRGLLEQAVRSNMNMLRIWGGGIYEPDLFYELCDQLGLLVWQDFMFACAPYPEDEPAFAESVRQEAEYQLRRLRHHPSLALWCGNNECQLLHRFFDHLAQTRTDLAGTLYYEDILPAAVAALDPTTPYWPGSPYGGPNPNSMRAGDVHNWTVWHGFPPVPDADMAGAIDRSPEGVAYTRYAEDQGRFISEFGIHSSPVLATLRRWMEADDLVLGSPGFLDRIKDNPKDKVNGLLVSVTGLPQTLEQYVDFTMLTQAEGLKFGIEHFRRRKPHCAGTLIWQYNDCWPCVSWSLVDYDGAGKAGLYATARAYTPVLASFRMLEGGHVELWITNDTLKPLSGEAVVDLLRLDGGADWSRTVGYHIAANSSAAIWRGEVPAAAPDRVLCVHSPARQFEANRHFLAPIKDLRLASAGAPKMAIESRSERELDVRLSAEAYCLFVHLRSDRTGLRFSDNYFDLRPRESRTIRVSCEDGSLSADELSVHCWNPPPAA